jgi:hypothetical protein
VLINESKSEPAFAQLLAELSRLRRFNGPAAEFWPAFVAASGGLIGACRGALVFRDGDQPGRFKKAADWSSDGRAERATPTFVGALPEVAENCLKDGTCVRALERGAMPATEHFVIATALPLEGQAGQCVIAFLVLNLTAHQARERVERLQLVADTPAAYQLQFGVVQAKSDVEKFAAVLDLMTVVNAEKRFLAAAMAFCNGIATRYDCDRVSLGWLERGYIRLRAMSRTERFDRNMAAVKLLEMAMEEAFDQDEELLYPRPEGSSVVTKDHEKFAREHSVNHLCSLPVRHEDKPIAVLTCERQKRPFSQAELQQLRLACDQAVHRLATLKRHDRWFGARGATAAREQLAKLLGPEHTWAKALSLLGAVALVVLFLPIFNYRVEGNFILRSDDVSYLTAPFDGYLSKVNVRPGDTIQSNAALLTLDTADLELDEIAALAEHTRYTRETEKARAAAESSRGLKESALAEMKIARALADQAKARLELIRYRLVRATVKAPFDGVLVEGDLRQRIGAPLKQGDPLLRLARIDTLYVEAEIEERDVQEILNKTSGEIAFVTQPKLTFPVNVTRIESAAVPKEGKNVFLVRCAPAGKPEPWWRPGMSGLCKLNVEKRTLFWIITHRTVDFLRMFLWW